MNDPGTQVVELAKFSDQRRTVSKSLHVGPASASTAFENPAVGLRVFHRIALGTSGDASIRGLDPIAGQPRRYRGLFLGNPAVVGFPFVRSDLQKKRLGSRHRASFSAQGFDKLWQ